MHLHGVRGSCLLKNSITRPRIQSSSGPRRTNRTWPSWGQQGSMKPGTPCKTTTRESRQWPERPRGSIGLSWPREVSRIPCIKLAECAGSDSGSGTHPEAIPAPCGRIQPRPADANQDWLRHPERVAQSVVCNSLVKSAALAGIFGCRIGCRAAYAAVSSRRLSSARAGRQKQ